MLKPTIEPDRLDDAAASAIEAAGGDLRAALKQLILTNRRLEAELREAAANVSSGFLRRGKTGYPASMAHGSVHN